MKDDKKIEVETPEDGSIDPGAEPEAGEEGTDGGISAEDLTETLEAKTKEAAENYDKFLRACADLDNYKKRAEREKADAINFANETLLHDVLPVVDNFERALIHANSDQNIASLKEGVKLAIDQVYGVLQRYGLTEIKAMGEKFNPELHHAISHEETSEAEEGTIVREFQKGYTLKGRLLRPSMVAVAKPPENSGGSPSVH